MSAMKDATNKTVNVGGTSFAYREVGAVGGIPLVLLHHVTAVLDDWDPAVVDGLAVERHLILVDLRGVGASGGTTPDTFEAMAEDAVAFVEALGLGTVDLLGYSLGGIVAQLIAQTHPGLVRRIVFAATTPAGAKGPASTGAVLQAAAQRAASEGKHPKNFLFFEPTPASQEAADSFLHRLEERTEDRDTPVTDETIAAQLTALASWEQDASPASLKNLNHPAFVVNGDNDAMWPTTGTLELAQALPNAKLAIYPDSGHGAIFQYHDLFVQQTLEFLRG